MKYVYADADKKNMLNTIVYLGYTDNKLYKTYFMGTGPEHYGPTFLDPLTKEELEKLYSEGMLILHPLANTYVTPIALMYGTNEGVEYAYVTTTAFGYAGDENFPKPEKVNRSYHVNELYKAGDDYWLIESGQNKASKSMLEKSIVEVGISKIGLTIPQDKIISNTAVGYCMPEDEDYGFIIFFIEEDGELVLRRAYTKEYTK